MKAPRQSRPYSKESEITPPKYKQYNALIGKKRDAVCSSLGLVDKDMKEVSIGLYSIPQKAEYLGFSFDVLLAFDSKSDQLYGFRYMLKYQNEPEKASQATVDLLKQMAKIYGEPYTYPGLMSRLKGQMNLADSFSGKKIFDAAETWKMDNPENFFLNLKASADGNSSVTISLQYQLELKPGG